MDKRKSALENLAVKDLFGKTYQGIRVLVTGHTGFKGSWLAFWLDQLGAEVIGLALEPETQPNHFSLLDLPIRSIFTDIRDREVLDRAINESRPAIVFHLAAQALVRRSYRVPVETYATNVLGTVNLFEACRKTDSVRAIINVTSDKCYENREWVWGYRENDPVGGFDPYSSSKACAELVTSSWRNSFFHPDQYGKKHRILLASARSGNVIGGGDWSEDRLIPDIIRAIAAGEPITIRNPKAARPWQHVLEPLSGYLLLGQKLLAGARDCADAWNFGPGEGASLSVGEVVPQIKVCWNSFEYELKPEADQPHEAGLLKLDCSKARVNLNWRPVWDSQETFEKTAAWYKHFYTNQVVQTKEDLLAYLTAAQETGLCWTKG